MIKLKPESVPVYPGHETVSAYFPFGEMAVTTLIEGQLAFLHHVRTYEEAHPGTRLLQRNLCWKIEFLNCYLASLPKEQLEQIAGGRQAWWPAKWLGGAKFQDPFEGTSAAFRRGSRSFNRFVDWDFSIGISAIQGHSRTPEQVADIAQGERLSQQRAMELGYIFHASENQNYESIKRDGLLLRATRKGWQRHRVAIHMVYAGGSVSPGPGTVVRYGNNIFYAQLDIGSFFNHGHELFLTDNGVVLCYSDIAPMYLTFHY
ncbi:unnamed protein product, partial [Symbiodinium microadriaticum]